MERVADYVVRRLLEEKVGTVFMITGRGILYLSDAVARNKDIHSVSMYNEQAVAYAAVSYGQYNDHLGACIVSTGCASTNTITGVLNAWQDGVPVIFISGQNKLHETVAYTGKHIRTWGSQEVDIMPIVKPITKYCKTITDSASIGEEMDKAIYYATTGVKGPVWIDIPVDVQNMRVEPEQLSRWHNTETAVSELTTSDLDLFKDMLSHSKRPVFLIGSGVRSACAVDAFRNLAERTEVPVCFSASAVDTFGTSHCLSMGVVSSVGGTRAGNFAVQNADLVISLGCRLSPMLTGPQYDKFARNAKIVVIDIDKNEHSKNTVSIDKFIISDAGHFIEAISGIDYTAPKEWIEKCKHWKAIFPYCELQSDDGRGIDLYDFASHLSKVLSENAVVLTDAGLEELIIPSTVSFRDGQRCLHPASQGCMGVALPASIGAYYSCGHDVVAVIGDGSAMMNIQELQTISYNHILAKLFIINNNMYSVIRTRQHELFRTRTIGTDPDNGVGEPDFKKLADSFSIPYLNISSVEYLDEGIKQTLTAEGPIICEIKGIENQQYLRNGAAFNSQHKFVMRPIEDQIPFIDRDLFKKEMIVTPIDL